MVKLAFSISFSNPYCLFRLPHPARTTVSPPSYPPVAATTKTTLEPYNFKGRYNLVRFLKTMQKAGLYAHLRIGPYVCVEWNFGGLSEKHVMETPLLSLSLEVFDGRLDDPISVSIRGGLYSSFHCFWKNV
ncbi:hypothetical protein ACFX2F_017300 [Malus domestica]